MKTRNYEFKTTEFQIYHLDILLPEDSLLFDIETTGFSAKYQSIYMIGVGYRKKDTIFISLYYALTEDEENEILLAFSDTVSSYKRLISFNGDMFDIPFLKERFKKHGYPHPFSQIQSLDLFKEAKKYKKFLNLEHYKQKDLENYFGLFREDQYNGGQLIDLYKKQAKSPNEAEQNLLFLHNMEDVKGMVCLLQLLDFSYITSLNFQLTEVLFDNNELQFQGNFGVALNLNLKLLKDNAFIQIKNDKIFGHIRIYTGTMKYFFKDYKNYVYIPDEDLLLPKALSSSIDKSRIQKATKEQCYASKEGYFIEKLLSTDEREFKKEYGDKKNYIEINPNQLSTPYIQNYIQALIVQ